MSDPQPVPGRRKPRRAEPLQPDLPVRGDDADPGKEADAPAEAPATDRLREQSEAALDNVREGYGKR